MFGYFAKLLFWSFLHCFAALEAKGRLEMKCSDNWSPNDNSCYLISKYAKPWSVAKKECEKNSASLAKISSLSEHRFLAEMMRTSPHKNGEFAYCWIGLQRCQTNGLPHKEKFCWLDGSQAGFTHWGRGQPNNNQDRPHECAAQQMNKGTWNDKACIANYLYVCERVLPAAPKISVTNITTKSAVVTWKSGGEGSLGISHYRIMVQGIREQPLYSTSSTLELKNLQQRTDYTVQVQAVASFGDGKPSKMIMFQTAGELQTPQIRRLIAIKQIQGASDDGIYLLCETTGSLPFSFTWKKNGKLVRTQPKTWQTSAQLKITETAEKATEYECTVRNNRGTDRKNITLENVAQCQRKQDQLVQGLPHAPWLSVLVFLVIVFLVIILLMRHRFRKSERTQSVDEDTRLEIVTPSSASETNSSSDDVSRDVDHTVPAVPVYSSPVLNQQPQSVSPGTHNAGELKYNYAYDHTAGVRIRFYSLANHTYVNDSEVSLDKLKSRKTSQSFGIFRTHAQGLDNCRPVSEFLNRRHQYVNTTKSLPEWSKFSPHLLPDRNQTIKERIDYVNSSQITDKPLRDGKTLNKPESEACGSSQSESLPVGLPRSKSHNTLGGEGYISMTQATT